jgi:hypothetical protein
MIISWVAEYEHTDQQTLSEEEQPKQNRESIRKTQRTSAVPLVYVYFTEQTFNRLTNFFFMIYSWCLLHVCILSVLLTHCENCCVFLCVFICVFCDVNVKLNYILNKM